MRSFTDRSVGGFPKWKITAKYEVDEKVDERLNVSPESHLKIVRENVSMVLYGVIHHEYMKRTRDNFIASKKEIYKDFENSGAMREYDESIAAYLKNSSYWNRRMLEGISQNSGIYSKVKIHSITITTSYGEVWEFNMDLLKGDAK